MKQLQCSYRFVATALFSGALLLSACGSSASSDTTALPTEEPATVPEASAAVSETSASAAEPAATETTAAVAASGDAPAAPDAPAAGAAVDGEWKIIQGSEAGYRVPEVLQGQKTEGVGRTTVITGSMTIAGTQATAGEFTFDLTKLASDSGKRDEQVQGRIMETGKFPNAVFKLSGPVDFGKVPADKETVKAKAKGELTLHGVTKPVEVDLEARMNGANVEVLGSLPLTFADYGIEDPSFKPFVEVGETGFIEWLLVMAK
jgi:polyisoprenoid-binding protein YceI